MITPPDPDLADDRIADRVMAERVRVFIDRAVAGAWTSPLGTLLLAGVESAVAGWGRALIWLCLVNLAEIMIIVTGRLYKRAKPSDGEALRWARRCIFWTFLAGICWGASVWLFWVDGEFTYYLLNLTVLIGVSGICVVIMSPFLSAMALFSAGTLLLPVVHIVATAIPHGLEIATGLTILYALLLQYSGVAGHELTSGIESVARNLVLAERLDLALGATSDGLWDWNLKTGIAYLSPRYYEMTGFNPGEIIANQEFFEQSMHPDDRQRVLTTIARHLSGETAQSVVEYRMVTKNRGIKWIIGKGKVVERDELGTPLRMVGTISDISERKHMELSLEKESQRTQSILRTASDGIHILDLDGNVMEANDAFAALVGYSREETLSLNASRWDTEWTKQDAKSTSKLKLYEAGPSILERSFRRRDGQIVEVEISVNPVDLDGRRLLYCSARDTTRRKRAEEKLRELATTDFMTGLFNRRSFIARLEEELARFQRTVDQHTALLMLDLDFFKRINDRYGHPTGDAMLKHFAELMSGELRRIDSAGRLGGEEFGIILPGANLPSARTFAERLCRKVAASPLMREGVGIELTVSIGVAVFRRADIDALAVIDRADRALYRAKDLGRNRVEVDNDVGPENASGP